MALLQLRQVGVVVGVALPVLGQEQAPQVRVPFEVQAEEIEDLAFRLDLLRAFEAEFDDLWKRFAS